MAYTVYNDGWTTIPVCWTSIGRVLSSLCSIKIAIYWVNHLSLMVDSHKSSNRLLDGWNPIVSFVLLKPPCFDGEIPQSFCIVHESPVAQEVPNGSAACLRWRRRAKNSWDLWILSGHIWWNIYIWYIYIYMNIWSGMIFGFFWCFFVWNYGISRLNLFQVATGACRSADQTLQAGGPGWTWPEMATLPIKTLGFVIFPYTLW